MRFFFCICHSSFVRQAGGSCPVKIITRPNVIWDQNSCTQHTLPKKSYEYTDHICMLALVSKDDPKFKHYEHMLANPIHAAGNPASSKRARLFAMYQISSPRVDKWVIWAFVPSVAFWVLFRVYHDIKSMYANPNERCPLVDTEAFKQQGRDHPMFGKPANGFDLFHGTKKDAVPSIM